MKHVGTKVINTERITLRLVETSDSHAMFNNWANDCEVTKFLTWKPHETLESVENIIKLWIKDYEKDSTYHWGIELKEVGELIGSIGIVTLDEDSKSCEIGYCIGKKYWGQGIVTEALKGIIDYLFNETDINKIAACHDTNNPASGKVMMKSGMKFEGTLRECKYRDGYGFYDLSYYSILRKEWI